MAPKDASFVSWQWVTGILASILGFLLVSCASWVVGEIRTVQTEVAAIKSDVTLIKSQVNAADRARMSAGVIAAPGMTRTN